MNAADLPLGAPPRGGHRPAPGGRDRSPNPAAGAFSALLVPGRAPLPGREAPHEAVTQHHQQDQRYRLRLDRCETDHTRDLGHGPHHGDQQVEQRRRAVITARNGDEPSLRPYARTRSVDTADHGEHGEARPPEPRGGVTADLGEQPHQRRQQEREADAADAAAQGRPAHPVVATPDHVPPEADEREAGGREQGVERADIHPASCARGGPPWSGTAPGSAPRAPGTGRRTEAVRWRTPPRRGRAPTPAGAYPRGTDTPPPPGRMRERVATAGAKCRGRARRPVSTVAPEGGHPAAGRRRVSRARAAPSPAGGTGRPDGPRCPRPRRPPPGSRPRDCGW